MVKEEEVMGRLPGEVVVSLSLEAFWKRLAICLSHVTQQWDLF